MDLGLQGKRVLITGATGSHQPCASPGKARNSLSLVADPSRQSGHLRALCAKGANGEARVAQLDVRTSLHSLWLALTRGQSRPTECRSRAEQLLGDPPFAQTLSQAGTPEPAIEQLAKDAAKQQHLLVNNPRPVALQDAIDLYRAAY